MKTKTLQPAMGRTILGMEKSATSWLLKSVALLFCLFLSGMSMAQPPSHDPTKMVRSEDGRYWIFTTGTGIWAMSSSNSNFSNWQPDQTPFQPGRWPSWINSAVPGFAGDFWAPGITYMNGYWYLYYSCSTFGSSRSAIGVVRTSSLSNPNWSDQGMVVSSNGSGSAINAIDPAIFHDTNGRVWMTYGSFFGGIGIVEINPSTGKTMGGVTHIAGGGHQDIEAPYIIKNGNYYYLFVNRGSCCNGLNSTYYVQVGRSTNVTGPYSGWRTILGNEGRYVGPGHIGYGEDRLTYHFYDGNDNGAAKLRITSLGWSSGWPVIHGSGGWEEGGGSSSVYRLQNRGTGLYLDGLGRSGNGDACAQWGNTSHPNAQWEFIDAGSGYVQLKNIGTGLFLDGMGRTNNGADCGMWANTSHPNSHWSVQQFDGNYHRLQNRTSGLYLDGMGRTGNGDAMGQWGNTTHPNAQWLLLPMSGSKTIDLESEAINEIAENLVIYPNPAQDYFTVNIPDFQGNEEIQVVNIMGQKLLDLKVNSQNQKVEIDQLLPGQYILQLKTSEGIQIQRFAKN